MKRISLLIAVGLFGFELFASDTIGVDTTMKIGGTYVCGNETIFIDAKNSTFYLKRNLPKVINDALVPVCYDTLAKGNFKIVADHVIELFNDREFYTPYYSIKQEKKLSEDTVYFNIVLPKDDAFSAKRFRYVLYFDAPVYQNTFESALGVIPKSLIIYQHSQKSPLSFSIQDLEPLVRIGEAKSYQRTYFAIFNLAECDLRNNYFTITLLNFNECFVERMDIDKDYIFWDGRNIHWRGKEYTQASS